METGVPLAGVGLEVLSGTNWFLQSLEVKLNFYVDYFL